MGDCCSLVGLSICEGLAGVRRNHARSSLVPAQRGACLRLSLTSVTGDAPDPKRKINFRATLSAARARLLVSLEPREEVATRHVQRLGGNEQRAVIGAETR